MVNHNSLTPQANNKLTQDSSRAERFRKVARRAVGTVAVLAAAGGTIFGIAKATESHSGPAYDKKTEAGIERVIEGSLKQAGQMALRDRGGIAYQPKSGITEINDSTSNGNVGYTVAFGNYPGTDKPNPNDVLAAELMNDSGGGSGYFASDNVVLAKPESIGYLFTANDFGEDSGQDYTLDSGGYTALRIENSGQDYMIEKDTTIDSADSALFAKGSNGISLGPVGTAQAVVEATPNHITQIQKALNIPPTKLG